jgi:DNA-binding response OmpR family regulator
MENKILVVEDDSQVVKLYSENLNGKGYFLDIASNADEALTKLNTNIYGLVILDIMLPGRMNGFDILEKMKNDQKLKNIPVMVLTNLDSEEKTAKEIGANMYLVKSNTSIGEIIEKIKSFFN